MEKITENDIWRYNRAGCNAMPQVLRQKMCFGPPRTLRQVGLRGALIGELFLTPLLSGGGRGADLTEGPTVGAQTSQQGAEAAKTAWTSAY